MKCRNCGAQASDGVPDCDFCGSRLSNDEDLGTEQVSSQTQPQESTKGASQQLNAEIAGTVSPNIDLTGPTAGLPDYYIKAFEEFKRSGGAGLKPKFNLGAFAFGGFWYLYRGLWAKGLLYFAIVLGSGGTAAVIPWIYGFMFGTYDLYLLKKDHKQLW